MLRTKRTAHYLYILTLLACFLSLLTWAAANAQETSPPDASTEVSQESEGTAPDQGEVANDKQGKEEVSAPPDVMPPPMMRPSRAPPAFDPKKYDWIRLTSGEWLKGEILSMRDNKFEFDSDEMDEQNFDWEDIAELRSSRKYTYVLTDRKSLIGTAAHGSPRSAAILAMLFSFSITTSSYLRSAILPAHSCLRFLRTKLLLRSSFFKYISPFAI